MWFNSEVTLPEENSSNIVNVVRLPEFIRTLAIYSIAPVGLLVLAVLCVILKVPSCCSGGDRSNMEKVPVEENSDTTVNEKAGFLELPTIIKSRPSDLQSSSLLANKTLNWNSTFDFTNVPVLKTEKYFLSLCKTNTWLSIKELIIYGLLFVCDDVQ